MSDTVEHLHHSLIQHGPLNNRIYLMKLDKRDLSTIFLSMEEIAKTNQYTKIFAKIPQWALSEAKQHQYTIEAEIPQLFNNRTNGFFVSKFFNSKRERISNQVREIINEVHEKIESYSNWRGKTLLSEKMILKRLTTNDVKDLSSLYSKVFSSYPFPIQNPYYLQKMMNADVEYYGIFEDGKLIAASAAEMNKADGYVEMTDFATMPEKRGNNFALILLNHMQQKMRKKGIDTAFTIARATSFGMNITFAKAGYNFSGLLKNNTAIAGNLENMNVLHKKINGKA
jgi:putative beta-lysine N-acetyltransferase